MNKRRQPYVANKKETITKRTRFNCVLCSGTKYFHHQTKIYPLFENIQLSKPSWYKCPFCNDQPQIKQEDIDAVPSDAPPEVNKYNYAPFTYDVANVSPLLSQRLIALGYPPDIAFTVAKNPNILPTAAEQQAEEILLSRLEIIQMVRF